MIRTQWWHNNEVKTGGEEQLRLWQEHGGVIWLDMVDESDVHEQQLLRSVGCHPLAVQDAQRYRHPPKYEDFDHNTLLIYRGLESYDQDINIKHVQLAFFIGNNFLITRRNGTSIGVQTLWDSVEDLQRFLPEPAILFTRIVNHSLGAYITCMLDLEETISGMEDEMLERPTDNLMQRFVSYRSRLRKLNRVFSYHEKIFSQILRESTSVLDMSNPAIYHSVQDVYDKCERLDSLGTLFYEQCGDLVEGYLSLTSHQLNKTMQFLTVITAIFVPLGLLSGIYGMNFENMPELHSRYGYFILLGVMLSVAAGLLLFFRRRGWL